MYLYTLHEGEKEFRFRFSRIAESPTDAAKAWGGTFRARKGGMAKSSCDPDELHICGTVSFGPELFREMDSTDEALKGMLLGDVVYTDNGMALLAHRGQTVRFTIRRHDVQGLKEQ